ncbi:MAG: hypothetical protein AB7K09_20825, partial [Planctomycetota bacterium]
MNDADTAGQILHSDTDAATRLAWPLRVLWLLLLVPAVAGAAAWWLWMPRGFPLGHPRWWINELLAPLTSLLAGAALIRAWQQRWPATCWFAAGMGGATVAAAIIAHLMFPLSMPMSRTALVLAVGALWWLAAWMTPRRDGRHGALLVGFALAG